MDNFNFNRTFSDFDRLSRFFIGSEKVAESLNKTLNSLANTAINSNYPPFNLKKTEENKYVLEMAVAGFGKNDIEMILEENKLTIRGQTTIDNLVSDGIDQNFLHKGISDRPFSRTFSLADNVVINNANMVNGLLKIWLEHIIPDNKKPRKIEINDSEATEVDISTEKKKAK